MLSRIEKAYPGFIEKHVDLLAGTSTGGLIAMLLAAGYHADEVVEIYSAWIPEIFKKEHKRSWSVEWSKYASAGLQIAGVPALLWLAYLWRPPQARARAYILIKITNMAS